jgi:hypothetical protein
MMEFVDKKLLYKVGLRKYACKKKFIDFGKNDKI